LKYYEHFFRKQAHHVCFRLKYICRKLCLRWFVSFTNSFQSFKLMSMHMYAVLTLCSINIVENAITSVIKCEDSPTLFKFITFNYVKTQFCMDVNTSICIDSKFAWDISLSNHSVLTQSILVICFKIFRTTCVEIF
jgi:hypothetical protein